MLRPPQTSGTYRLEKTMGLRLSRSTLMLASALTMTAAGPGVALAQDGSAQLGSIEKQIAGPAGRAAAHEGRDGPAEPGAEGRPRRDGSPRATPPGDAARAGDAADPGRLCAGARGAGLGSLVRWCWPAPKGAEAQERCPKGTFQVGAVNVTLGGFLEAARPSTARGTPAQRHRDAVQRRAVPLQPALPRVGVPRVRPGRRACPPPSTRTPTR